MLTFSEWIGFLGCSSGLFLFLLIIRSYKGVSGILLAVQIFITAIEIFLIGLGNKAFYMRYPFLAYWSQLLPLLIAALSYLYIKYTVYNKNRFSKMDLLLFIPFFAYFAYLSPVIFATTTRKTGIISRLKENYIPEPLIFDDGKVLFFMVVIVAGLSLIRRNRNNMEISKYRWLIQFTIMLSVVIVVEFINLNLGAILHVQRNGNPSVIGFVVVTIIIYWLYFKATKDFNFYTASESTPVKNVDLRLTNEEEPGTDPEKKYLSQKLPDDFIRASADRLRKYMEDERPFSKPDFTLQHLADSLHLSRHQLSQVINAGFEKNFNELVNQYRVELVKKLLLDPSKAHLSIYGISMEAGFSSKASFQNNFKKLTGMTPTAFLTVKKMKMRA